MAERRKQSDVISIGNTHLTKNFFESLRGKTASEIKAERPGMHDLIIDEIIKKRQSQKRKQRRSLRKRIPRKSKTKKPCPLGWGFFL